MLFIDNKFILSIRFRDHDGTFTYSHYVLDEKYSDVIDFENFNCLKRIPDVVLSDKSFKHINALSCFSIFNGVRV